jgi:hypothetical protein
LGALIVRKNLTYATGDYDSNNSANRFIHALGAEFQASGDNVGAVRGLMNQARIDLLALNLTFELRDDAPVAHGVPGSGYQYMATGMTNLGKAVVSTIMKRSGVGSVSPSTSKSSQAIPAQALA